jgi:hypothetical protein
MLHFHAVYIAHLHASLTRRQGYHLDCMLMDGLPTGPWMCPSCEMVQHAGAHPASPRGTMARTSFGLGSPRYQQQLGFMGRGM